MSTQSEQQQRIMGYFIEEAKDHLNTIETGLLNLQTTIADSEMVNEVFRAAHSVKGGAAMLGLGSIQKTSHRLEDYFKVLRECPVQVDQKLESLFLRVFDSLQELIDQLQGPFGLTEDKSDEVMANVEPVFAALNEHLNNLVSASGGAPPEEVDLSVGAVATPAPAPQRAAPQEESALQLVFQSDIPVHLRSMLQLFKQPDQADSRQALQDMCRTLSQAGEQFDLNAWCQLLDHARRAIAHTDNTYRTLAPILIKELKQAQELVLTGRSEQITCSDALADLVPATLPELDLDFGEALDIDADLDSLFADNEPANITESTDLDFLTATDTLPSSSGFLSFDDMADLDLGGASSTETSNLEDDWFTESADSNETADASTSMTADGQPGDGLDLIDALDDDPNALRSVEQAGPEVGAAELNTLADLFEGESIDLGWQEEVVAADAGFEDALEPEPANDFSDLLFDPLEATDASSTGSEAIAADNADPSPVSLDGLPNFEATFIQGDTQDESLGMDLDAGDTSQTSSLDFLNDLTEGDDDSDNSSFDIDLFGDSDTSSSSDVDLFGDSGTSDLDASDLSTGDLDFLDGLEESGDDRSLGLDDLLTSHETHDPDGVESHPQDDASTPSPVLSNLDDEMGDLDAMFNEDSSDRGLASLETDLWGDLDSSDDALLTNFLDDNLDDTGASDVSLTDMEGAETSLEPDANFPDDLDVARADTNELSAEDELDNLFDEADEPGSEAETDLWITESSEESSSTALDSAEGEDALDLDQLLDDSQGDASQDDASQGEFESWLTESGTEDDDQSLGDLFGDSDDDLAVDLDHDLPDELTDTRETALDGLDLDLGLDLPSGAIASEETTGMDLFEQSVTANPDAFVADLFSDDDDLPATEASAFQEDNDLNLAELDFDLGTFGDGADVEGNDPFSFDEMPTSSAASPAEEDELDLNALDQFLDDEASEPEDSSNPPEAIAAGNFDLNHVFDLDDNEPDAFTDSFDDSFDDSFADLDSLLDEEPSTSATDDDDFADLDALLDDTPTAIPSASATTQDDFADLDALLNDDALDTSSSEGVTESGDDDFSDFDDLEKLLEDADNTLGGPPTSKGVRRSSPATTSRRTVRRGQSDQTMRVSVRNLDNLNNLIGELVVNRNSLEQTQERLRQFLDNLLYQVQQLSDVGQRMRDLYERSLLESSLLSSRKGHFGGGAAAPQNDAQHATGANFDALEMDRFTGFHTLSQEMIELIVRVRESASDIDFVVDESDQITRTFRQVTTQLQEGLTRSRMVPFAQTADRLPRAVRDISLKCGKQAELVVEGRDTLIDKMILESLYDPMTHLVNNAITHGIETPEERVAAGKPPLGRITIRSFHQGNQTVISISDDGAGIDSERVKAKAMQKGLVTPQEAREMTRLDVYDLLFHSGFTTRDKADDFAGRGVGMDVVRTNLTEIRGAINTDSTLGKGTTFTIRLPLTLSISKALCCISNRARIAFPMDGVEDMLDVPRDRIQTDSEGRSCITWREMLLPFQPLSELLSHNRSLGRGSVYGGSQEDEMVSVIVLRSSGNFLALQVDQVLGEQEIVIKQLEGPVPKPVGIAGATVLGDGRIMPIADVLELIDLSMGRIRRDSGSSLWTKDDLTTPDTTPSKSEPTVLIVDDSITVRELLSMTFNKVGYRVEQARDGQEAWEKLRSGLPCDLVFCDIEMPRMDGLELLSRIQKDPSLTDLPIAMLTSRGADRHRQMAITLGAKGYFTKPYLEEALLDAAQRMLKGEVLVGPAS
ncbi:MAG: hybrid sensor histidine kinase/response regulator [Leptolyngbya sp. DLM2.Bin15]|nr:MAG: hybrid sensor histidine kinase/response regulator [Leptolyngbya sp. DLM2.Bin15]